MALRDYSGNAKSTTLAGDISASATSITVADGTGYPTGATGPFVVTVDAGLAGEEKVLCTSRTGNTLTVSSRGWDGTSASDHANAATVQHTISATDLREANAHVNDSTGDPHPQYLTDAAGAAAYVSKAGGSEVVTSGAAVKGLVVKGAASQTANAVEVQNSAGAVLARIGPAGDFYSDFAVTAGAAGTPTAHLNAHASAATNKGLVVKAAASQTANLAEFQDSAGTALLAVTAVGRLRFFDASPSATAGTNGAVPAQVKGYLSVIDNTGSEVKIPYYLP